MKLRLVRDASGSPSWTCTLAIPAAIVLTGRILIGGFAIDFGHWKMAIGPADTTTVLALASYLGFFAQRDITRRIWGDKTADRDGGGPRTAASVSPGVATEQP